MRLPTCHRCSREIRRGAPVTDDGTDVRGDTRWIHTACAVTPGDAPPPATKSRAELVADAIERDMSGPLQDVQPSARAELVAAALERLGEPDEDYRGSDRAAAVADAIERLEADEHNYQL